MATKPIKRDKTVLGGVHFLDVHVFSAPHERVVSRRTGEEAEIIVMLGGIYRARREEKHGCQRVEAKVGDVICWPFCTDRTEESDPHNPAKCLAIYFKNCEAVKDFPRVVRDQHGILRSLAERLLEAHVSSLRIPWNMKDAYLAGLLAEYQHIAAAHIEDSLVARVTRYAEDHMAEPIQLSSLARHIGFDKRHFSRKFKSLTNQTPMQFIRRQKALRAMGVLRMYPRRPLQQIAPYIGVSDEVQVRRLLRKYCGVSLREIRKMEVVPLDRRMRT